MLFLICPPDPLFFLQLDSAKLVRADRLLADDLVLDELFQLEALVASSTRNHVTEKELAHEG